jgi:tetratricopeptide (TPR) repeat protein
MTTAWGPIAGVGAALAIGLASVARPVSASAEAGDDALAHRLRGLEFGYNLDYPEALAAFQDAMRVDPNDPGAPRLAAVTIWMRLLFKQGAVTVDDYMGQMRSDVRRPEPEPALAAEFKRHIDLSLALAEKKLRANPRDPDAQFHFGSAAATRASYVATIEGRVGQSVSYARKAYAAHRRSLALDSKRADAGLIVGAYRYTVAGLPFHMRVLARLAGLEGGRTEGLELVEKAARYASPAQANALFTLVLLYNREGRHDDALKTVRELQNRFPRNRLLWLEEAGTALRANRPAEALAALDHGRTMLTTDTRPRAYGEAARWSYLRGAALVVLGRTADASPELDTALSEEGPAWVRGRAHLERGKLADLRADRAQALQEYRAALQICRAQDDEVCTDSAKALLQRPHTR